MTDRHTRDRGSVATELVLLVPVLVVMLLLVVYAGRSGVVVNQVRHAADQGARAASLVRPSAMATAAQRAVTADLAANGSACEAPNVTVSSSFAEPLAVVSVRVSCAVDRSGLELLRPGPRRVSATSTEVIDRYRVP